MPADRTMHLTDRVKLDLMRLIEADNLKPGDKLPPADQLCLQFQVSRTVVREAIASLKAEGRLRSLRGPGALGVDEPFELAAVEEDSSALGALVDGDSVALVLAHLAVALGTRHAGRLAALAGRFPGDQRLRFLRPVLGVPRPGRQRGRGAAVSGLPWFAY